jgi:uncharacterized membrane protein YfcA
MDLWSGLGIASAGLAAGAVNTVVGSGTLITFPTLLAFGYSPLVANVSNTIGLVPGSLSGVQAYRRELAGPEQKSRLLRLSGFSASGAVLGSALLLIFPGSAFRRVVPWLILLACTLVVVQPWARRKLGSGGPGSGGSGGPGSGGSGGPGSGRPASSIEGGPGKLAAQSVGQALRFDRRGGTLVAVAFATGVYGGYFGAAQGVILISVLTIFIADHLQRLNALKNVLALLANFVAGVIFAFSGHVSWAAAGVVAAGATVGGQVGGRLGRRLPPQLLRLVIVLVGTAVAVVLLA